METIKNIKGITTEIKLSWCAEDVIELAKQGNNILSPEEAGEVLDRVLKHHDCNEGVSWDVLECHIGDVLSERAE